MTRSGRLAVVAGTSVRRPRPSKAFTLVELVVVVSVIAVLVTILVPYFSQVFEITYSTMCQHNLKGLSDILHTSENPDMTVPTPGSWVGTVVGRGGRDLLRCLKGGTATEEISHEVGMDALQDVYILQYHTSSQSDWDASFLPSILGAGGPAVDDPQVWAWYPAGGVHDAPKGEEWPAAYLPNFEEMRQKNQAFIGVDNDSGVLITFKRTEIIFECWEPPDKNYSRHWLMQGAGTPVHPLSDGQSPDDEDDKELLRMWSRDFQKIDARCPFGFSCIVGDASYGMNGLIEAANWRPGQLMLMDANETVIDIGTGNFEDILEEVVAPRHMGKVNVVTVGGSVTSMTLLELEQEMEEPDNRWRNR
jgi:prepilin-type N-terminal cleavage/methylation domain-containing protein